jgi:hypothetical protein
MIVTIFQFFEYFTKYIASIFTVFDDFYLFYRMIATGSSELAKNRHFHTHCLGLASIFFFFWSLIRHVSSYQKKLGCSLFFIRFLKKLTTFSKMEISISVKFLLSFINLITQHKTASYVKLFNSDIGKNIFLFFSNFGTIWSP